MINYHNNHPYSTPKLQVDGVTKSFYSNGERLDVLRNISLDLYDTEFVCVLGESGCGKTTLLNIIAGTEPCSSGRMFMDGKPVEGPSSTRGMVFQKPLLFPWLTVWKNISFGLDMRNDVEAKETRVADAIKLVGLKGFDAYKPAKLSGGMAQRVSLARALVNEPEILLLDEPFSALDAVTRRRMQEELLRIWQEKACTTVFVTHDLDEAILLGTRIVVMSPRPGEIREVIPVPLSHPRARTSREFLAFRAEVSTIFFAATKRLAYA